MLQYAFQYTDANRKKLAKYEDEKSLLDYLRHQKVILDRFVKYAQERGVKQRNLLIQKSYDLLEKGIYANIIYNMLGREAYIMYVNKSDETVKKALEILKAGKALPEAPPVVEKSAMIKNNDERSETRTTQTNCTGKTPAWRLYAQCSF
jgi:carboxyl-terminal processing protease